LPEPASAHGWYYFETLHSHQNKENYIAVGIYPGTLENLFDEVTIAAVITHPYSIPHEKNRPIAVCRGARVNLKQYWMVERHIDPHFDQIRRDQGVHAAINYYLDQKSANPRTVLFSERQINTLGYQYLQTGKIDDAITLFRLNVETYPKSWNVYDSLAEAYMEDKQYDLAVKFYNVSIEINPDNENGKQQLEKIVRLMQK
jgi:tetratricopeptide (TPR) repeat protein